MPGTVLKWTYQQGRSGWALARGHPYWASSILLACLLAILLVWPGVVPGPGSSIQRAWTLIAVVGLVFTAWALWDNWLNVQAVRQGVRLRRVPNRGSSWWLAVGSLGSSLGFLFVWLGFISVGLMVLFDFLRAYAGWWLVFLVLVLAAIQGWQFVVRYQVRKQP